MARTSPLAGYAFPVHDRLGLREVPFVTQVNVRLDAGGPALAGVAAALGGPLPAQPNTVRTCGDLAVLWLGPDEWLVIGPAPGPAGSGPAPGLPGSGRPAAGSERLTRVIRDAVGAEPASVVDVSAQRTTIEVSGDRAGELLAHGCALDLDPRVFGPGRCAQTLLARVQVIILGVDRGYRILVRSSYARYLAEWLVDAATEYATA
jgi:sarcosine oxidase, subunit gamma